MSFFYGKVISDPMSFKTYGFQNVSSAEMQSIVRRLQKQTYNTELYHGECFQSTPSPPREPGANCRRAKSASTEMRQRKPKVVFLNERELERAYKRVRTPTISKMASEGKIATSYETNFDAMYRINNQKEYTPLEQKKMTRRLLRPTEAYRNKRFYSCSNDPDLAKYYQYDYSADNDVAPAEVVQEIVDRVRTPTIASEGGIGPTCPKRKDSIGKRATMKNMPLISGLPRSRTVDEIVNRLYTPTEVIPICRPTSAYGTSRQGNNRMSDLRPKSASSAISPRYLRSLSSYSTTSSNSSLAKSGQGSNRSSNSKYQSNAANNNRPSSSLSSASKSSGKPLKEVKIKESDTAAHDDDKPCSVNDDSSQNGGLVQLDDSKPTLKDTELVEKSSTDDHIERVREENKPDDSINQRAEDDEQVVVNNYCVGEEDETPHDKVQMKSRHSDKEEREPTKFFISDDGSMKDVQNESDNNDNDIQWKSDNNKNQKNIEEMNNSEDDDRKASDKKQTHENKYSDNESTAQTHDQTNIPPDDTATKTNDVTSQKSQDNATEQKSDDEHGHKSNGNENGGDTGGNFVMDDEFIHPPSLTLSTGSESSPRSDVTDMSIGKKARRSSVTSSTR